MPAAAKRRRGRPRQPGNRYPSGKLRPEPANAVMLWKRQEVAVEKDLIRPEWGSEIGRLRRFDNITIEEMAMALRWAELRGRADAISGTQRPSAASPSYDRGFVNGSASSNPSISPEQVDVLEAARKADKEVFFHAGREPYNVLFSTALTNCRIGSEERVLLLKRALKVLITLWNR